MGKMGKEQQTYPSDEFAGVQRTYQVFSRWFGAVRRQGLQPQLVP
jgi:hypothetical protein